jgi:ribosomal-protein-alanine N-acetyltransferase
MGLSYCDLNTDRLHLRRPRPGDAPLIFESFGTDSEVTRYLTWAPHRSVADAELALFARIDRLNREVEYSWVIELTSSCRVIGLISVWVESNDAEVGFVLAREHWNQGFTTQALEEVTRWAFAEPSIAKVWATCDVENGASSRVLAKAGFVEHGNFERRILRPNISPEPRLSLLFEIERSSFAALSV